MQIIKDAQITGSMGKPILLDIFYEESGSRKPIVIFTHGFKGFKDWGHFDVVAEEFAKNGFVFVKYNGSHNGTTPEHPKEFVDEEAFGENNFSIELRDIGKVIDFMTMVQTNVPVDEIDTEEVHLMGHSRGGGISILQAWQDPRVKKLITWASVAEFGRYWDEELLKKWEKEGVQKVKNSRTGQELPMYYQIVEDYEKNKDLLHIPTAAEEMDKPWLIVHGTEDEGVDYKAAETLYELSQQGQLLKVEGGGHTFGAKHPWESDDLPSPADAVVAESIDFLK